MEKIRHKLLKKIISLFLIIAMGTVSVQSLSFNSEYCKAAAYVQKHGRLKVKGTNIADKNGKTVRLKGVSSHGINWDVGYPYITEKTFKTLRDKWKVNTVRLAMYTQEYNGYCVTDAASRKKLLDTIDTGVKAAKKLGLYVIIDWHVLNDRTPLKYQEKAKKFFAQMSKKYASYQNVLYEICNEPNGGTTWSDIKKYAKKVIPVIRKNDKNGIIIVGTPNWSQDVDIAAKSPIKGYKNIMYSIHFYAATHGDSYRNKLKTAHKNGLPVICTEFGTCDSSGNGKYDFSSANKWIKLMNSYNMGYVCWSLSNKPESASLLKASCKKTSGFTGNDLSGQGKWLVGKYKK
jgi:aryl-phospho-beta-D-glucosidase BglC (GH1 family)